MAVFSQPKEYPIEVRRAGSKKASDRFLVVKRGFIGIIEVGRWGMDVLGRYLHVIEKSLAHHEVITVGMIDGNVTLVRPKEVDVLPRDLVPKLGSEKLVEQSGRAPPRQSDAEPSSPRRPLTGRGSERLRHRSTQPSPIPKYPYVVHSHQGVRREKLKR
jgi:hypothetical protein